MFLQSRCSRSSIQVTPIWAGLLIYMLFPYITLCIQSLLSSLVSQKRTDMPILIVGNKMDLPEATGVDEYAVRQALDVDQVSHTPSSS